MALVKITPIKGVTAEYWTVANYSSNKQNNITNVTLRLYKDEDTRRESMENHLDSMDVTLNGYNLTLDDIYPMVQEAQTARDTIETNEETGEVTRTPFFADAQSDE